MAAERGVRGIAIGLWLISELVDEASGSVVEPPVVLAVSAAFMLVGILACLVPTLRGMRVRPVEALKEG